MEGFRSHMQVVESYEESQGREYAASQAFLAAYYKDGERKELVEHKISNTSNPLWSSIPHLSRPNYGPETEKSSRGVEDRESVMQEEREEKVPQTNSPRSIIPETMKERPAWYKKDIWATVPLPSIKLKYKLHNPIGPRWYKNHHLIPPSQTRPAARPPTIFSSSFPPITTSTSQDRSEDAILIQGPSRTPSNSPLPTPNSSQTRVSDANGKPRSRKTSQTAHDNVDLLDVTDPWGTNWHHHSPYDVGLSNGPISIEVQDALHTRSRRSSMTTQTRQKAVIPSPLSQSTSAVHLSASRNVIIPFPRKLSKRHRQTIDNVVSGSKQVTERNAVSLPATPVDDLVSSSEPLYPLLSAPRHPVSSFQTHLSKKEKRGSILDRLIKKFSILRKHASEDRRVNGKGDDWQYIGGLDSAGDHFLRHDITLDVRTSLEKPHSDATKRIPPPQIDDVLAKENSGKIVIEADCGSSITFEAPFSTGRLTIANPDTPDSRDTTPAQREQPLPLDKIEDSDRQPLVGTQSLPIPPPNPQDTEMLGVIQITPSVPPQPPTKKDSDTSTVTSTTIPRPNSVDSERPLPPQKSKTSIRPASSIASYGSRRSGRDIQSQIIYVDNLATIPRSAESSQKHRGGPMSHTSQKPQPVPPPPGKTRPVSTTPSIPFPASDPVDWPQFYDYTPLSAVSMLANPPTPYTHEADKLSPLDNPPQPWPRSPQEMPTPTEASTGQNSRQTETFRLVRSPSGHVYPTNEMIVAGGHQWEIVEASERKNRSKAISRSKDKESKEGSSRDQRSSGQREKKRESRSQAEPSTDHRHHSRSHRNEKAKLGERSVSSPRGTDPPTSNLRQESRKGARRGNEDRERRTDRKLEATSATLDINKPQPPPPPPTPGTKPLALERRPSLSTRPTSQLASASEMNALRAKEAWDMERLWKARSMTDNEPNGYTTIPPLTGSPMMGVINDDPNFHHAIHGSSHTAFVVQTPFQTQHSIYHSMPTNPPPIIYSPSSISSIPQPLTAANHLPKQKVYSTSISPDPKPFMPSIRPFVTSRLPEPPQQSPYEPTPLPGSSARSSDYWARVAGLTTSD